MKTVAFCVVVVGLAIAASGQTASAPNQANVMAHEITSSAEATHLRGSVEIRFGTTVIRAAEADITKSAPGDASEIALRACVSGRFSTPSRRVELAPTGGLGYNR